MLDKFKELTKQIVSDKNGNPSSKRIGGFFALAVMLFIGIYAVIKEPSQAASILWPIGTVIGVLFGASVVERKV